MHEAKPLTVAIIDYEMGNLFSVSQACEYASLDARITADKDIIKNSQAMILPGVGAFGDAMASLKRLDLIGPIIDFIQSGRPFMGICLGMQLLMSESEEFGAHQGLNIIPGKVIRFPVSKSATTIDKVPQVGWNRINGVSWDNSPLCGVNNGEYMYFVHSYYCKPEKEDVILSTTAYSGITYASSILSGNIYASQFHAEKSALVGLKVYKNWADRVRKTQEERK